MKKIKFISLCVLGAIAFSCGTSNNVVSGKLITKRKVNNGFYINSSHNLKGNKEEEKTIERAEFIQYTEEVEVISNTSDAVEMQSFEVSRNHDYPLVEDVISAQLNEEETNKNKTHSSLSSSINTKTARQINKEQKQTFKSTVKATKKESKKRGDDMLILMYIFCIIIPPIAVGLATDWDITTIFINVLWCLLCGVPGIIHAFIVVSREN